MARDIGSRIAHYDVTARIGEGGMGQVFQADDMGRLASHIFEKETDG